ncbi:MAG: hypothetical protein RR482_06300, partial [Clostridia bacterium]
MPKFTLRFRLFCTMLMIFLLPLCILGGLGSYWAKHSVMESASSAYGITMQHVAARLDRDMQELQDVALLLSNEPLIKRLAWMQGDTVDYTRISGYDLNALSQQLGLFCSSSSLYSSLALCFPTKNFAISLRGTWQLDWLWEDEYDVENMSIADWRQLLSKPSDTFILPRIAMSTFGHKQQGLLYGSNIIHSTYDKVLLTVLFWLDDNQIASYLQDLIIFPSAVASIVDDEGRFVSLLGKADDEITQFLREEQSEDRFHAQNGEFYRVMQLHSAALGWRYTVLLPESEMFAEARRLNTIIWILIAVVFMVGCVLSLELAIINYKPLERVFALLGSWSATRNALTRRDMAEVEGQLISLIEEQKRLNARVDESRELLQFAALSHLLSGDASVRDHGLLDMLGIPMSLPWYSVGIFYRDYEGTLEDLLQACHKAQVCAYPVREGSALTVLFNHAQRNALRQVAQALTGLPVAMGVSSAYDTQASLQDALLEARRAVEYRPAFQEVGIFFFSDWCADGRVIYYPMESEQRMINALCAGDEKQACACFDALLERNLADTLSNQMIERLFLAVELTA